MRSSIIKTGFPASPASPALRSPAKASLFSLHGKNREAAPHSKSTKGRMKKAAPYQRTNSPSALEELALFLEIDLILGQKKRFERRLKAAMTAAKNH